MPSVNEIDALVANSLAALAADRHVITLDFNYDGDGVGKRRPSDADGRWREGGERASAQTIAYRMSLDETLDIGVKFGKLGKVTSASRKRNWPRSSWRSTARAGSGAPSRNERGQSLLTANEGLVMSAMGQLLTFCISMRKSAKGR